MVFLEYQPPTGGVGPVGAKAGCINHVHTVIGRYRTLSDAIGAIGGAVR